LKKFHYLCIFFRRALDASTTTVCRAGNKAFKKQFVTLIAGIADFCRHFYGPAAAAAAPFSHLSPARFE
jgi:hypothetical protein